MSNGNPLTHRLILYGVICLLLLACVGVAAWFSLRTGEWEQIEARSEARVEEVRGELDRFSAKLDAVVKQLENQPRIVSVDDGPSGSGEAKLVSVSDSRTLASARLSRFRAAVQETEAAIGDVSATAQEWAILEPDVRTGDPGRKIAADPQLVRRLRAAFGAPVATPADVAAMSEELAAIEESVEARIAANPADAPGEAVIQEVELIKQKVRSGQQGLRKRLVVTRSTITASNQREPAQGTLDEAFAELEAAEVADQLLERERVLEEAKAEAEQRVADAIRELESAKQLVRLAELSEATGQELAEAERIAREAAQRRRDELARIEYAQRRREAMRAENVRLLAPFTGKDVLQPTRPGRRPEETDRAQPISLSRLEELGALESSHGGDKTLLYIACYKWTDRPRWNLGARFNYPYMDLSASDSAMLRRVRGLFEDYGDVYVKEGLLAP